MIYNVPLEISKEEYLELVSGKSEIMGLMKNTATKRVERHIPRVVVPKDAASENGKYGKIGYLIGIGCVVAVGIAAATIAIVKNKGKKKNEASKLNEKQVVSCYNQSVENYFNEAKAGTLSYKSLLKFLTYFESIVNGSESGDIRLELSNEEVEVLSRLIARFTIKLCEANKYKIPEGFEVEEKISQLTTRDKLKKTKEYLYIQKTVFEKNRDVKEEENYIYGLSRISRTEPKTQGEKD